MSRTRSTVWRWAGAAAGALAIGAGVEVARRRRGIAARRGAGDATPLGSLRSAPHTVVTPDGVPLHCEVDEPSDPDAETAVTVVFVHGYALTLDCWHFQRAG